VIKANNALVVAILRHGARQHPLSPLPALHSAGDVEQKAWLVGQHMAMLAGDLIVADPATTVRALEGARRGVNGGQKMRPDANGRSSGLPKCASLDSRISACPLVRESWRRVGHCVGSPYPSYRWALGGSENGPPILSQF
jgi:hypothetical protein